MDAGLGGIAAGAGNTIAFNNGAGVVIFATVVNFAISSNAIFGNQGFDILSGDSANEGGFEDGAWVQEVINAVELSYRERRWVSLPLA